MPLTNHMTIDSVIVSFVMGAIMVAFMFIGYYYMSDYYEYKGKEGQDEKPDE